MTDQPIKLGKPVRFLWTQGWMRPFNHRQDEAFLLLPCDWRFLPKLGPAAAGVQGLLLGSRLVQSRH